MNILTKKGIFCIQQWQISSLQITLAGSPREDSDFCKTKLNHWKKCFEDLALQNKAFVVNWFVNKAELVEIKYFKLIRYIVGLQTGAGISKWGNFFSKWGTYYKE